MGLYTNPSFSGYASSNYTSVEPFKGEHFNYHELGIMAATESAANRNAFMKAIALNELASMEQYGTDQVFYESVNLSGIFDKIKTFFKKIIEKIHKIIHTFIAKLSSWFQSSKDFAKKYEKEIIKKWGLVKNDWEFKGYKFTNLPANAGNLAEVSDAKDNLKVDSSGGNTAIGNLINAKNKETLLNAINDIQATDSNIEPNPAGTASSMKIGGAGNDDETKKAAALNVGKENIRKFKDNMDNWKDKVRGSIVSTIASSNGKGLTSINMDSSTTKSLDSKEFTEELFKVFRNNEDSKEDIGLKDLDSATDVISYLKEYDKIKTRVERLENAMVKSIDELIKAINDAGNAIINDKNDMNANKLDNEYIVSTVSLYESCWGFVKEAQTQAFTAFLQALKDKCAQCKEVCVKVVSSSKKMTEESVDYSNYSGNFNSFIENVKLV